MTVPIRNIRGLVRVEIAPPIPQFAGLPIALHWLLFMNRCALLVPNDCASARGTDWFSELYRLNSAETEYLSLKWNTRRILKSSWDNLGVSWEAGAAS